LVLDIPGYDPFVSIHLYFIGLLGSQVGYQGKGKRNGINAEPGSKTDVKRLGRD
jgi:hypothetical protein